MRNFHTSQLKAPHLREQETALCISISRSLFAVGNVYWSIPVPPSGPPLESVCQDQRRQRRVSIFVTNSDPSRDYGLRAPRFVQLDCEHFFTRSSYYETPHSYAYCPLCIWRIPYYLYHCQMENELMEKYWIITEENVGILGRNFQMTFRLDTNPCAPLFWKDDAEV
ncbi:hypothetical protein P153DRAFT_29287 [Dothidotthia symphoricarpi CBS 119687]|uniref:Uncharacterized protein n=1 Tax=Dothidotthia symphoricarpi CBS 119687 TaxID=1392245 RepID=A0A6A6ADM0_9PLEO|nr:uncharacterized protein P153DRAFT_29287 [Dothidotthia symphoricarpi CBS 119687]KAF2128977.1 hypothetical protein P153DRAFT_29287 [Dothidotthia symphoricarpi CBS 119687]